MAVIQAILTGSIFINPLRTILQPQVYFTGMVSINRRHIRVVPPTKSYIGIRNIIVQICIINNTFPRRITGSQS